MRVELQRSVGEEWARVAGIAIGEDCAARSTPDLFVTVTAEDAPRLHIDLYARPDECRAFEDALVWHDWIVIGFGECVYLVPLPDGNPQTLILGDYFGHLYPLDDILLAASGVRLLCISRDGQVMWTSAALGIDGVLVDDVSEGMIYGQGEWDPPGGWRPFAVSLETGEQRRPFEEAVTETDALKGT